jgi:L-ascorbate metabolism protein UlaG (beta-lactamase superfamily)
MANPKVPKHYSAESDKYYNLPSPGKSAPQIGFWESVAIAKEIFFDKASRAPESKMPEIKTNIEEFLKPSPHLKFVWFGHSTLLLNLDGKILLIDPVFSNYAFALDLFVKRFQPPVLKLEELPMIDAIVISHNHYDHLDKETVLFFKEKQTRFILPKGVGENLQDWGIPASRMVELDWEESVSELGLTFTATPAQHFSGRGLTDRNDTLWASWVIQGKEEKLFYSGDSGYGDHFKAIGEKHGPFDVTFIENGQYNERWPDVHMQPEESLQAHLDLKGHYIVPVHWGMFDLALHHWSEPVERTYKIATDWSIPYLSPKLGQIVDLGETDNLKPWWQEVKVKSPAINLSKIPSTN